MFCYPRTYAPMAHLSNAAPLCEILAGPPETWLRLPSAHDSALIEEAICRGAASWILRCIPVPCCPRLPPAAASCPSECGIGLFALPATAPDASRPGDEYGKLRSRSAGGIPDTAKRAFSYALSRCRLVPPQRSCHCFHPPRT